MTLRRKLSAEEQAEVEKHEQQAQTAVKMREAVERFRNTFSLNALLDELPLRFPAKQAAPLSFRALSWYTYPGWEALRQARDLSALGAFYSALHLIDFSPLRAELVSLVPIRLDSRGQTRRLRYQRSRRWPGQQPARRIPGDGSRGDSRSATCHRSGGFIRIHRDRRGNPRPRCACARRSSRSGSRWWL